jgi:hypothetical protein
MKKLLMSIFTIVSASVFSQALSPIVVSSAGDHSTTTSVSLNWTLGELATETFSNGSYTLTQGFHQPVEGIIITGINLNLLVYLEGPFSGSDMATTLNAEGYLPLSQPYNAEPWNYNGSESVLAIPNPNVVDWVYIQLRDAASAGEALPSTTIASQAAFLLKDGSVVGIDGSSMLQFNISFSHQLFVIIWHRNHLGIMSANAVTQSSGIYSYDFSTSAAKVHGGNAGYRNMPGGVWGMAAGDANHDGFLDLGDISIWAAFTGEKGYHDADFNRNIQVNNPDKNNFWLPNRTLSSQVPQ